MRRILLVMSVAALMVAMLVATAMPAFAARSGGGGSFITGVCDVDNCVNIRGGGGGGSGTGGGGGGGTNSVATADQCDSSGQCVLTAERLGGGGGGSGTGGGGSGGGGPR